MCHCWRHISVHAWHVDTLKKAIKECLLYTCRRIMGRRMVVIIHRCSSSQHWKQLMELFLSFCSMGTSPLTARAWSYHGMVGCAWCR